MKNTEKTHWLQSPNKNYLGHWDLPESGEITLTIESAKWEAVENPVLRQTEEKRVVRFLEDIKPMICNQTNAESIVKSTGVKFMEDSTGCKITLFIETIVDKRSKEDMECIRVKKTKVVIKKPELTPEHPRWEGAKAAVKTGEATKEDIEHHLYVSESNWKLLCS